MLLPVEIPPGYFRAGTEYQSRGRWYDGSLVRFFAGTIQPIGGWEAVNESTLTGRPCALLAWRPNDALIGRYLAIGTNSKAYAYDGATITDITPGDFVTGTTDATSTQGYGAGQYGDGLYGTPRTGTAGVTPVDAWHFDTWGQNLIGCYTADGRIFEWDLDTGNDFVAITNAPEDCRGIVVTSERILMALGADGDVRKIAWSDQEDNTVWTPGPTNTAGDLFLTTDGRVMTGERVRQGVLIHTDTDAHLVTYVGGSFVYGVDRVGDNCGIVSANAKITTASFAVWMSFNGFWMFDGYVKPLQCDVHDYVFTDINRTQISKVCGWHNGEWGEIWWFYPASSSEENSRYVVWNYRENHWAFGTLSRTAAIDKGPWDNPTAADASGTWYAHESGTLPVGSAKGGTASDEYLESGPLELMPGERMVWLNQVIHDESEQTDALELTIKTRFTPEGTETTHGPYSMTSDYTDVRAQGRHYKLRVSASGQSDWRLGTFRVDAQAAGKR